MRRINAFGTDWLSVPVKYCLCFTVEEYEYANKICGRKHYRPFVNEGAHATTHTFELPNGRGRGATVCINLQPDWTIEQIHGLLVHEAVHVFQEIMSAWGETEPGSETMAYFVQTVATDLFYELTRYYKEHPHAHPDYRKHHKKGTNVVRRRRRNNAKGA